MPKPPLPPEAVELLRRPNPCVMATVRSDGTPITTPTWYVWDDGRVLVNLDGSRVRLKHLRADPRVTFSVMDKDDWYTHVSLIGRVAEMYDDEGMTDIDRIAGHYTGSPYPNRVNPRVSVWVEVERWHVWGALKES
jgi:PPOX class probable F420-dependent enzyme